MNLGNIAAEALGEMTNKRLQNLYQRDFTAWKSDVLGFKTYEKMQHITETALFGDIPRTAIKSSNGTSKSFEVSAMVLWVGSVFDISQTVSIISAPSLDQVEKTTFKYLKSFKARAADRGYKLPGVINESLEWWVPGPEGHITLAYGKKPAPGSEVNTFQGVRSEYGHTYVFFDEAGGMAKGMWTAAEAVLTGASARLVAIGNPDDAGTEWERIFKEKKYDNDFNRFSISAFDLPTFTGEVVYEDDPVMEKRMLESLTQVEWVEHKKRIWGEKDARYISKVLGEFPKEGGNGFFPQSAIDAAYDHRVENFKDYPVVLGVDIARYGQDECVIAENRGGRVRVVKTWGKTSTTESARIIHDYAISCGAEEIRIDAGGVGGGVYDTLIEKEGSYELVGWDNGSRSPDPTQWQNLRAYAHDNLRTQMMEGQIDLDYDDSELREELQLITYKFSTRGGITITAKDDLKNSLGGSPDRLDAVIMAATDMSPWTGNELNKMTPGDRVLLDPSEVVLADATDWYSGVHGTF